MLSSSSISGIIKVMILAITAVVIVVVLDDINEDIPSLLSSIGNTISGWFGGTPSVGSTAAGSGAGWGLATIALLVVGFGAFFL